MNKQSPQEHDSSRMGIVLMLRKLFSHVSKRRRFHFLLLLCLTLISSITEVVSLGSVVPFIGILTQPEKVFNSPMMSGPVHMLGISTSGELVMPLAVVFAVAAVFAGAIRVLLLWTGIRIANATGADLGVEAYKRTLLQPYSVHVAQNSSEVISGITQKIGAATSILTSLVTIVTSAVLFIAIFITLLLIDPVVASAAAFSFGGTYAFIAWAARQKLKQNSQCIAEEQTSVVKVLQEGLGAIRDVLLDGSQALYCQSYGKSVNRLLRSTGENQCITLAPRFIMEALGMVLIAILAYVLSLRPGGIGAALPVLGALALAAQRLLPLLQQLYGNWSYVAGSRALLGDVLKLLEQPLPGHAFQTVEPLSFRECIKFEHVCFQYYTEGPAVLQDINLRVEKGSCVGFVGTTGSGKSSLVDLIMGLLEPKSGRILVDGQPLVDQRARAWQMNIAHVPQQIFLSDATFAENIAFGMSVEHIDMDRVRWAAEQACIADYIEKYPEGYQAVVGERGVRLSGGQRQRIGIARAMYKNASVLILDEATSALDSATEHAVMERIRENNRNLTVLMIAHRIQTLEDCDLIVRLERGVAVAEQTYEEFVNS